eukprot:snap_masked-scaffold_12-processed-gene-10.29-mRNA-1 protein AED:1.00 eAED:1.00 QI:0/-1/0/0/-1/1/1/0/339
MELMKVGCLDTSSGVLDLFRSGSVLGVIKEDFKVELRDLSGDGGVVLELNDHTARIRGGVYFGDQKGLITAGEDGNIFMYDIRQSNKSVKTFMVPEPIVSDSESVSTKGTESSSGWGCVDIGFGETIFAGGTQRGNDSDIVFYDMRSSKVLAQFNESHSDSITSLEFCKRKAQLLSASTDGLVCTFNITKTGEDDALASVLNFGDPVKKAGYFGPESSMAFALGNSENFGLFNISEATLVKLFSQCDDLEEQSEILDTMISAQYFEQAQKLFLSSGRENNFQLNDVQIEKLTPILHANNSHSDFVTCVDILAIDNNNLPERLISASLDRKIGLWTANRG